MARKLSSFLLAGLAAAGLLLNAPAQQSGLVVQAATATAGEQVDAAAAIVMEAHTGRVLFAQNSDAKLPVASLTKIMTALIALEQPDIYAEFEVNPEMLKVEGSSMGLKEGDRVSLHALGVGLLLASGNDAANVTAARISGAIPAFAKRMNDRAAKIGMNNTSFSNPSGLDGDDHYSTAYDMALLAREALKNDDFRNICSQYRIRTSYGNPPYDRWHINHNKLLNYCEGVIGMKTGFTKKAGRCLVSVAERGGMTLICVTLDCPDDWTVHENMYDRFFGEIHMQELSDGVPDVLIPVTGGTAAEVQALCYDKVAVPVPNAGAKITYRVVAPHFLYAPVQAGQYVGDLVVLINDQPVHTFSLVAAGGVAQLNPPKPSLGERAWELLQKIASNMYYESWTPVSPTASIL